MIELKSTRPEVRKTLQILEDTLIEMEIVHIVERDAENPDLWSVGAAEERENHPGDPVIHLGFVGWNSGEKSVNFAGYDSGRSERNKKEGIEGDEGLAMLNLKTLDLLVLWLTGDFHRIFKEAEKKMRAMNETAEEVTPKLVESIVDSQTEPAAEVIQLESRSVNSRRRPDYQILHEHAPFFLPSDSRRPL